MRGIATSMAVRGATNQITGRDLNETVERLIAAMPDSVSLGSNALLGESRKPLRQRLKETEYGIDHIKTDVRACGLLVDDPASPGTFRFGHKSFMEYLFAEVVWRKIKEPEDEIANSLLRAINGSVEDILALPESVDFLAELIGGDGPQLELTRAENLRRTLFQQSGLASWLNRFFIVTYYLRRSLGRRRKKALAITVTLSILTTSMMSMLVQRVTSPEPQRGSSEIIYLAMIFLMGVMFMFPALLLSQGSAVPRVKLWDILCDKLNITKSVRVRVTGGILASVFIERLTAIGASKERNL
jgi:hypothetical protein